MFCDTFLKLSTLKMFLCPPAIFSIYKLSACSLAFQLLSFREISSLLLGFGFRLG